MEQCSAPRKQIAIIRPGSAAFADRPIGGAQHQQDFPVGVRTPRIGIPIRGFKLNDQEIAVLLGAPLLRFLHGGCLRLGEEVDLLCNDLAAAAGLARIVGPASVVDATSDLEHCALGDVLGDRFADAVEAGYPVPFGFGLAVPLAVLEAARGGKSDAGHRGSTLRGADFDIVANEADEGNGVFHEIDLLKLFCRLRTIPFGEPR